MELERVPWHDHDHDSSIDPRSTDEIIDVEGYEVTPLLSKRHAKIVFGILLFAIPYCLLFGYMGIDMAEPGTHPVLAALFMIALPFLASAAIVIPVAGLIMAVKAFTEDS